MKIKTNTDPEIFGKCFNKSNRDLSIKYRGNLNISEIAKTWSGTGIVIPAGGIKYGANAYINIRYIKDTLRSELPIELWSANRDEQIHARIIFNDLKKRYGDEIKLINAEDVSRIYPFDGNLQGYPIKPFAIFHSSFEEIFYIDSDCFVFMKPEKLLQHKIYQEHQALFCSDIDLFHETSGRLHEKDNNFRVPRLGTWNQHTHDWKYDKKNPIWDILGIQEDDLPEFESGLICINKNKHIKALNNVLFLNENHEFTYNYICGDKDTFKLGWAKEGNKLNLIKDVRPNHRFIQGFLDGQILYQHRVVDAKYDANKRWTEFPNSLECHNKHIYRQYFKEMTDTIGNENFENTYRQKASPDSLMPGSQKGNSERYVEYINGLIESKKITSILDVGSGGGLMLSHLNIPQETLVSCLDLSSEAISMCKETFQQYKNYSYIQKDICELSNDKKYDLVLIKDVFQHLSYRDISLIMTLVEKIAKYAVITNDCPSKNEDILRSQYRPIDIIDIYSHEYEHYELYSAGSTTKNIVVYNYNNLNK